MVSEAISRTSPRPSAKVSSHPPRSISSTTGILKAVLPFLIPVDEAWYLEQNPGVAEYIARGELESAQQHFNDNGYREGRKPFPR